MNSLAGLIARVERVQVPDRRLDAEITAALLGPEGCFINPFQTPDGWDIETAPDGDGETGYWREAADVGHLTHLVEDAISLVSEVRPKDGAAVVARALRSVLADGLTVGGYAQQLARAITAEVLRTVAQERQATSRVEAA